MATQHDLQYGYEGLPKLIKKRRYVLMPKGEILNHKNKNHEKTKSRYD
jgi:hypothetical protein